MTKSEYMAFHRACCDRMIEITKAKNADYTGAGDDPFANFSRVEVLGITDVERGFLVRMSDKFSRIVSFVQKGILLVKDESIEDTLLDFANYCILLAGFIRSRKSKDDINHVTFVPNYATGLVDEVIDDTSSSPRT